ncbi:hypothetical protein ACFLSS_02505 [Bacteroidota bacterium]
MGLSIRRVSPFAKSSKVNGKKLYELARKGKEIKRNPRMVHVEKFELTKIDLPEIHFNIKCSKGTYIRVIANDFGKKIGCGAVLNSLRRTNIGEYCVEDSLEVEEFVQKATAFV